MSSFARTALTPELAEARHAIAEVARGAGLDFYDTIFELVDYAQLSSVAAYGGFPSRYPHWRWGMAYDRLAKTYRYGLSTIYELVVNTNPSYAYLMTSNPMVLQKTVMAHVYGHVDFFKNNYWFSRTNRKMLDQVAHHGAEIRAMIQRLGEDTVEQFIDRCLCLDNLIDIHSPFRAAAPRPGGEGGDGPREAGGGGYDQDSWSQRATAPGKIRAKKYMDSYVNPADFLEAQKQRCLEQKTREEKFPARPERDVLLFLLHNAPLKGWQKRIVEIIRSEAYYFAPQAQTKILNEGWASYWHCKMMTELHPLSGSEIVDFCDLHAGVVAEHGDRLNPYRLGIELLRHVKKRWDEGKFGIDYISLDDPRRRREHIRSARLGNAKIFEIRRWHNDVTFVDEFLDEDFCHEHQMFLYRYDPKSSKKVIVSRDFQGIKKQLLDSITNLGQPIIEVMDGNYKNRGELLLKHHYTSSPLKQDQAIETLKALYALWTRPVHLISYWGGGPVSPGGHSGRDDGSSSKSDGEKCLSFDGSSHSFAPGVDVAS